MKDSITCLRSCCRCSCYWISRSTNLYNICTSFTNDSHLYEIFSMYYICNTCLDRLTRKHHRIISFYPYCDTLFEKLFLLANLYYPPNHYTLKVAQRNKICSHRLDSSQRQIDLTNPCMHNLRNLTLEILFVFKTA